MMAVQKWVRRFVLLSNTRSAAAGIKAPHFSGYADIFQCVASNYQTTFPLSMKKVNIL